MIGVISDLHLKENMPYSHAVPDGRRAEKAEVMAEVNRILKECGHVVLLGDMLDSRNNPSSVVREFTAFMENLGKRQVYLVAGNHERLSDGSTALDYLKELGDRPNWHLITDVETLRIDNLNCVFMPFKLNTSTEMDICRDRLLDEAGRGDILFTHHSVSDIQLHGGLTDDFRSEPVLPRTTLEQRFKLVVGGHIHIPQTAGKTWVVGGVFTSESGEALKRVLTINTGTLEVSSHKLPVHPIISLTDPDSDSLPDKAICHITVTEDYSKDLIRMCRLNDTLPTLYGYRLTVMKNRARRMSDAVPGFETMPMERMLEEYAKAKKIDFSLLKEAWELIRK